MSWLEEWVAFCEWAGWTPFLVRGGRFYLVNEVVER